MRFHDLFKPENDTPQSLTRNSDNGSSRGREGHGSFGIGPVNLQLGPLSTFRKRPGQNSAESDSTDEERRRSPKI